MALDRVSLYSPSFVGSSIATCIAKQLVKQTFVLSLEGSFTLFGKIEIGLCGSDYYDKLLASRFQQVC
jgi:hypothetical protein